MTLKSSLNIFNEKKDTKKRKLNELMSNDSDNNYLKAFEQHFSYKSNCDQNGRSYFETTYESTSKRSRNTINEEIMTSNVDFHFKRNTNPNNGKRPENKSYLNSFFNKVWNKFKFGKKEEKKEEYVVNDVNYENRLPFESNNEINGFGNDLNHYSNNTNFNNNPNILSQNIRHNHSEQTSNQINFSNNNMQNVLTKNIGNKKSLPLSESKTKTKRKKLIFHSFGLEDREKYRALLDCHLSQSNSKFSTIKSVNSGFNRFKKQEVIDLTSSQSSSNTNQLLKSSQSFHSSEEGISTEKLDNKSKNNLIERIKSEGIVAQPFFHKNLSQFKKVSQNKKLSLLSNTSDSHSVIENTPMPECSKKFNNLIIEKKQFFDSQWINDLRNSLSESFVKQDNNLFQSQRKVLDTKDKRENDCRNLESLIRVPYTRSELKSFVPYYPFEEKQLVDIEEEEDVEEEEDTIAKDLPILTPDMEKMVEEALISSPSDQIISEKFSLTITRKDMETLSGLNWLNDEVINFYFSLIVERSKNDNYSNAYAFNTFFYPKLISGGHQVLKRWTRKVDIFANDFIFIPVHLGVHWCLAVIDFKNKKINYYDSMGGKNMDCIQKLKTYIQEESVDKKKMKYDMSDWTLEVVKEIPQQGNGSDCGMFTCKYAEYISRNAKINFSQAHMPYFRRRMVYEILSQRLL